MTKIQNKLSHGQIKAFYHNDFVEDQARDFISLLGSSLDQPLDKVIDVGGGCGFFAKELQSRISSIVRVLDTDLYSIETCKQAGIEAFVGDALNPAIIGDEKVVCFNLILHHLVGRSDDETLKLQKQALSIWHSKVHAIFIHEYIYESFIASNISGWLIFQITSSQILSKASSFIAKIFPSLKANTFGVGVRFRSHKEWRRIFTSLGFDVVNSMIGREEFIPLPLRLLLIKSCRRDSFLLKPLNTWR